jgi:hypothetical protein
LLLALLSQPRRSPVAPREVVAAIADKRQHGSPVERRNRHAKARQFVVSRWRGGVMCVIDTYMSLKRTRGAWSVVTFCVVGAVAAASASLLGCAADVSDNAGSEAAPGPLVGKATVLTAAVEGDYRSQLGHIRLGADGTYEGGYQEHSDGTEPDETLIESAKARGVFSVAPGKFDKNTGLPLTNATIVLRDVDGTVTKSDLTRSGNGDLQVNRGTIRQIWVKQPRMR